MTYEMQATQLSNSTANPVNSVFDIFVTGTTNLTSTLMSPMFASNSHFLGVTSPDVAGSIPVILDSNGNPVSPGSSDVSYFNVEPLSGVTLSFQMSMQTNLQIVDDILFSGNPAYGTFIPCVINTRYMAMTDADIKWRLSTVTSLMTAQATVLTLTIIFAVVSLGVGGFFILKWHREHKLH